MSSLLFGNEYSVPNLDGWTALPIRYIVSSSASRTTVSCWRRDYGIYYCSSFRMFERQAITSIHSVMCATMFYYKIAINTIWSTVHLIYRIPSDWPYSDEGIRSPSVPRTGTPSPEGNLQSYLFSSRVGEYIEHLQIVKHLWLHRNATLPCQQFNNDLILFYVWLVII